MKTKCREAQLVAVLVIAVCGLTTPPLAQDCPELVGRWPYGPAYAVAVSGDFAYFGSGTVLLVADISNPASPQVVGEVAFPNSFLGVEVTGGYAYVADSGGLRVIDVSTPSSPIEVGFYDTPGDALAVAISARYAYVADSYTLRVIDVSTPSSPIEVGSVDTPGYPWYAYDVAVSGGYVYVAGGSALRVIDVSTPSLPIEVGFYDTPGYAAGVTVSGEFLHVAEAWAGFEIFNAWYCPGYVPLLPSPRRPRGRLTP